MQQQSSFDQWLELHSTAPHDAHLAIVHAAAYHEQGGDSVTVDELFTRAMNHHKMRHTTTMAKAPWAA